MNQGGPNTFELVSYCNHGNIIRKFEDNLTNIVCSFLYTPLVNVEFRTLSVDIGNMGHIYSKHKGKC